jgi:octaprenyl-diphosphate synthase
MAANIADIKAPIDQELKAFEEIFKNSMKSKVALLDKITHYIIKRKGKQIRPMFVFLIAKMCGKFNESTYRAASLIELLHTATLVHDDVVDESYERRGFFSINALWKNKIAVLVGDYLLSRGLLLSVNNNDFHLLKIVSEAVKEMSEGELLQIEKSRRLNLDENIYFDIIRQKTASLIASCCASGAASVTSDAEVINDMKQFGEKAGIAFQIKDDLFDYGNYRQIGKPTGIDIKEKKLTLPIIHVLNKVSSDKKKWMINIIKNHNTDQKKVSQLIDFVIENDGINYAASKMTEIKNDALNYLNRFEESESKTALIGLVNYTIERTK